MRDSELAAPVDKREEEQLFAHSRIPAAQRERCARRLRALAPGLKQRSGLRAQRSMLVALCGVDGGGKSTQACALRAAFEAGGVRARILWMRIGDTPLLHLLHAARKRYAPRKGPTPRRTFSRSGWRLALWAIVASADYAAWLQYVRWRLWRGDVVIADRYVCDFEVELGIRLRDEPHRAALLLRVLHSLAPTPKRAYLLRIDPALSRHRTGESGVGDPDAAAMQRRYDALMHRYSLRPYDASRPLEDLATALVQDALTAYGVRSTGL